MSYQPAPYAATATITRGTFQAEIMADGQTPAAAYAVLNELIRQLKLKAPRGKKYTHLQPSVTLGLISRVEAWDVEPGQDTDEPEPCTHTVILPGTQAMFAGVADLPVVQLAQVAAPIPTGTQPAPTPTAKPRRKPSRTRNYPNPASAISSYAQTILPARPTLPKILEAM